MPQFPRAPVPERSDRWPAKFVIQITQATPQIY
jgi:hypothetical protein